MLTIPEIISILGNPSMAVNGCFWVFDKRGTASQIRGTGFFEVFEKIQEYLGKQALWVRELENYSQRIRDYCTKVNSVNCHLIISPDNAVVLSRHYDIWDVYIKMLYGKREYEIEGQKKIVSAGETLLIKKGEMHEVHPQGNSITINFGIEKEPPKFALLENPYIDYPYNFKELFLENEFLKSFL